MDNKTYKLENLREHTSEEFTLDPSTNSEVKPLSAYVVQMINKSSLTIELARINNGNWFPIPTVNRTCRRNDCNDCFNAGEYLPIMTADCNDANFDLTVATRPDAEGRMRGAKFRITPDCNYAGGVICMG